MPITTTVTWADMRAALSDELGELRDAYDEIHDRVTDEYGDDALDRTLPNDPDDMDDDERQLWIYRQQIDQYNSAKQSIDNRLNMLDRLEDEYGSGDFEIKMLSGAETMDIETDLRLLAQQRDTSLDKVRHRRTLLVTDAATVDAPEGVPRDDEGSPQPSAAPNALAVSLWDHIDKLNNAGQTDFQPGGFGEGDPDPTPTTDTSAPPST